MKLHPVTFKIAVSTRTRDVHGFYVHGTDNLLAIDLRNSADELGADEWCITHIPTGRWAGLVSGHTFDNKQSAIAFAQGFYREFLALGVDLTSTDPQVITAKHNALSQAEKDALWKRVAGEEKAA